MAKAKRTAPRKIARKTAAKPRPGPGVDANLLADLMKWAKAAGADAADALYVNGESVAVAQRLGKREKLESSEGRDLGLRVFVGQRQAFVSSTDFSPKALRALAFKWIRVLHTCWINETPYDESVHLQNIEKKSPELWTRLQEFAKKRAVNNSVAAVLRTSNGCCTCAQRLRVTPFGSKFSLAIMSSLSREYIV